jgi:hypothetical protein
MHVIWHHDEIPRPIPLAIEVQQCFSHDAGNLWLSKDAFPMAGIQKVFATTVKFLFELVSQLRLKPRQNL